jgi:hypothetical protein
VLTYVNEPDAMDVAVKKDPRIPSATSMVQHCSNTRMVQHPPASCRAEGLDSSPAGQEISCANSSHRPIIRCLLASAPFPPANSSSNSSSNSGGVTPQLLQQYLACEHDTVSRAGMPSAMLDAVQALMAQDLFIYDANNDPPATHHGI